MIRSFQHIGKKANQEDSYFISDDQCLFVACDGVGGRSFGAQASATIVGQIGLQYQDVSNKKLDKIDIRIFIANAIDFLNSKAQKEPELLGASTTLALLYKKEEINIVAHIGDSRVIVLFANDQTPWSTKDHSMVQELFDAGVLTSEESMRTHPMNNRITRSITAGENHLDQVDIQSIPLKEKSTICLVCTDGLLEHYTTQDLADLFDTEGFDKAWEIIDQKCKDESRDNSTVISIQ